MHPSLLAQDKLFFCASLAQARNILRQVNFVLVQKCAFRIGRTSFAQGIFIRARWPFHTQGLQNNTHNILHSYILYHMILYYIIRVRGEPSERLIPSLGVGMGLGGDKFFIFLFLFFLFFLFSFAGPRAGPLYFDTQPPRRPRPTRKITPRLGLEVLFVKHQDLAVAGGC